MSARSVIETLDLHNDYGEYRSDSCAPQTYGWLSPRISFSTDFISGASDRVSPEKKKKVEDDDGSPNSYSADFEFSMSSFNISGNGSAGFIVPADELFHQGKLLPGFLPPGATAKDVATAESAVSAGALPEMPVGCPSTTIARHLNAEATGGPSPLGCVLGPSCLRTPKGPKWRELFGALRRVKSDSGRQRIPDESLLPPKTLQGRKKFFKQLFSTGGHGSHDPKLSSTSSSLGSAVHPSSSGPSSSSTSGRVSSSQDRNPAWDSSTRVSLRCTPAAAVDSRNKTSANNNPPQPSGTDPRGELKPSEFRGKSCDQSAEGFTFNPTPGRARASGSSGVSNSGRHISPLKAPLRGSSLGRSPSGRVIVRGLDRVASGRNSASLQEQVRALRSREIRRSPDRSGYSSVRVTPVLNVPVCMGPVLRGATKAGKGRLSNFRSFLTFKSKLPNSMSTPIATR